MVSSGVLLNGRYRLEERIASGGMGDVWKGTDEVLDRVVAIKIMLDALMEEKGFAERFRAEARTMATINHPGVVRIYDFGSDQVAYLIMEYVEGEPLSKTLSRIGRLTPTRTMSLIAQAAEALQAAHDKGIVHRDVKPGNLLVRPNGTLVLTDFGIARAAAAAQLTATGAVLGTASYIAPEQASGNPATALSDVYSLGIVAYQCLSGHRPFEGDTPLEIAMKHVTGTARPLPEDVPGPIRQVVERAMSKEPRARWESAESFAVAARHAASGTVPAQRPVVSVGRPVGSAQPFRPGAAAVPPPIPPTVNLTYRQQPVTTTPTTTGGGRAALIVVWVVLAVLTLVVCSYLGYKTRQSQNRTGGLPQSPVLSVAESRPEMMFQVTEGRLTR
ncbi:MAG TPA: serine/threonine-protein kinase [Candidatus Limnocylindrales bacterium]|nr:serine/threonine-protein kinase [Candidatus Limnocylindrales bacterium]